MIGSRVYRAGFLAVVLMAGGLSPMAVAQPIRQPTSQSSSHAQQQQMTESWSTVRVMLALGVVVSLILVGKWAARRFMIGGTTSGQTRAIQVVSRTIVSPKQQLMLVKVGRRLVVVANTSAGMNSLCEIRDEQEVAELLGQVTSGKGDPMTRAFGSLFRKEEDKFTGTDDPEERIPRDDSDTPAEVVEVSATREELSGLMEKVRLVSKQFRRS